MQGTGVGFQRLEVNLGAIGLALFPASKVDPDELEGQGATGLMMLAFVARLLLVVVAPGPGFLLERTARVFVKGLATELGAAVAEVDLLGITALDDHRCQAMELSHVRRAGEPLAIGAKSDQQTWGQRRTRGRKAPENGRVGMLVHGLRALLVQARD